jgi:hypothetical protein
MRRIIRGSSSEAQGSEAGGLTEEEWKVWWTIAFEMRGLQLDENTKKDVRLTER